MDHRSLPRPALIDFARNAAAAVAAGKVPELLPAQATAFANAINGIADDLKLRQDAVVTTRSAAQAATSSAKEGEDLLERTLSKLKFSMRGAGAATDEFYALGFTAPVSSRHTVVAKTPSNLGATGYSNGVNKLSWSRNNDSGSVMCVIEYKTSRHGPYAYLATVTSQKYNHKDVVPGQFYQYRVRAESPGGSVSGWSNEAAVYGSQPEAEQTA